MPPEDQHSELKELLQANNKLITENNVLLKKMHRTAVWGIWLRVSWYAVLFGLPFILYFYIIEPYFTMLGADYETFKAGMAEIPGIKSFNSMLDHSGQ